MARLTSTVPGAVPGFRFTISVDGIQIGQASKIEGLAVDTNVITYRGGAEPDTPRKQKGLTTYEDISIERLMTDNVGAWTWLGLVYEPTIGAFGLSSPVYKFNMTITFHDHDGTERYQYYVRNAWIKRYEISNVDSNSSNYVLEKITMAHEGLSRLGVSIF